MQCGHISVNEFICTAILVYRTGNLTIKFPSANKQNILNTKNDVSFLSATHPKHRKQISIPILNVYAPTTYQMNLNEFELSGAIFSLIFHLWCETITIYLFVKWIKWFPNHLHKNRKFEALTEQSRNRSSYLIPTTSKMESSFWR